VKVEPGFSDALGKSLLRARLDEALYIYQLVRSSGSFSRNIPLRDALEMRILRLRKLVASIEEKPRDSGPDS
jgi:hypothetical protein